MEYIKQTFRIEEKAFNMIKSIAEETNTTTTSVVEKALKFYSDYYYMNEKATFINDEILRSINAIIDIKLNNINSKTNQVLSELAIQNAIQNQIINNNLNVEDDEIPEYRKNAVEQLKINNRVFRFDELLK